MRACLWAVLLPLVACAPSVRTENCDKGECDAQSHRAQGVPRLYVDPPFGSTFACVLLGCDTTQKLTIENRGGGVLALASVRLAVDASAEFTLTYANADGTAQDRPTPTAPVELLAGEKLVAEVRYVPVDGAGDSTYLQIDWHDGTQNYATAAIQRVEMALSTRILGGVQSQLLTSSLSFGFVQPGNEIERVARVRNDAASGGILAITGVEVTADAPFYVAPGFLPFANPGEEIAVPVRFVPSIAQAYSAQLMVSTNDPTRPTQVVRLSGTALEGPHPRIVAPSSSVLDFGHARFGETVSRSIMLRNEGSATALLRMTFSGDPVFALSNDATEITLESLEEREILLTADGEAPGALTGTLTLSDEGGSALGLGLTFFCDAPELTATPSALSFEALAQGWVGATQTVVLTNSGVGELVLTSIGFELGSSTMVHQGAVGLPVSLSPDDPPLEIPVWIEAVAEGPVDAALLIESNALNAPITRVEIESVVQSCKVRCSVANGTSTCASGACAIGACDSGWHDADRAADNGCECQAERSGNDIGATCATGLSVGMLGDGCSNYPNDASRTGTLHSLTDIDLYYFNTEDRGGLFCDPVSDSAAVIISFVSAPADMVVCVRDVQEGSGCGGYTNYYDPDICRRSYRRDGSYGSDDNRDVTAWVMWKPTAAPQCGGYTLKMDARD